MISSKKNIGIYLIGFCSLMSLGLLSLRNSDIELDTSNDGYVQMDSVHLVYQQLKGNNKPSFILFMAGYEGYSKLLQKNKLKNPEVITLIDFRLSSNEKRLWVIDLQNDTVLFNDWVAHGKNSGVEFATIFSNRPKTNMSSLGFYVTGNAYQGQHGKSLQLYGVEKGINDNAFSRAIVIHGANYVSENFIINHGRLGRSFGCPAVSYELINPLIETIKDGTCLFIFAESDVYFSNTVLLPMEETFIAENYF